MKDWLRSIPSYEVDVARVYVKSWKLQGALAEVMRRSLVSRNLEIRQGKDIVRCRKEALTAQ